jgi:UPF0271 protein
MMTRIDLNSDMGEYSSPEAIAIEDEMMPLITSVNIACGGHAGSPDLMRRTAQRAIQHGVAIGAHPGFRDPEHFGRSEQTLTSKQIESLVASQIHTLASVLAEDRLTLTHVKPHGALYNLAGRDPVTAQAIVRAVQAIDRRFLLYAPANSELAKAGQAVGLAVVHEAFVDRAYRADCSLVPRSERGAVLETEADVRRQLHRLMTGSVVTVGGSSVQIHADSLCLHADTPQAVTLARIIRQEIQSAGIRIAAPS